MVSPGNTSNIPPSLLHPELLQLWQTIRQRLDRFGIDRRGKIPIPKMTQGATLALQSLLGRSLTARLDITLLEQALIAQGIGDNLHQSLLQLGAPPNENRAAHRAALERREQVRQQVETEVATWPEHWPEHWPERWATQWQEWLFRSGQFAGDEIVQALETVTQVRCLLDELNSNDHKNLPARNELAARLFGSSHALDDGLLLERCARRALWYITDRQSDPASSRDIWADAGISTDRVSAPVLVWQLPLNPSSSLGAIAHAANNAGVPIHLNQFALRKHQLDFINTKPVLLVENPRLVEAAAERDWPGCVIATNGNPSTAVVMLIDALLEQAVEVLHHGDFDSAGIGIVRRMMERGCKPWNMTAKDYQAAVESALESGLTLPVDSSVCGPTPWDTELQHCFDDSRAVVHEELLIEGILGAR